MTAGRNLNRRSRSRAGLAAAVCLAWLGVVQLIAAEGKFVQDRFGIGLWVDPPLNEQAQARYAEIAEANFTFVIGIFSAATPEAVKQQIELCRTNNLKVIVSMAEQEPAQLPTNSACWGYFVADEPGPGAYPALRKTVDDLRKARPGKLAYINMLPNYAPASALGTDNYDDFISTYLHAVKPDVLSMDHYPVFVPGSDGRQGYCQNLDVMRRMSLTAGIPFWNFFNTMPYGPHSDPTEAQLRWQIYTSLACGAKGVMYFCYWTPAGPEFPKGGAIIRRDGTRTRHYDEAKRINGAVKNLGPTLMKLTSTAVWHVRPGDKPIPDKDAPIKSITEGDYIIGAFKHEDGRRAVLLVNYEFAYSAWPTVEFAVDAAGVMEVSPKTGKEIPVKDDSPDMKGLQISLDAGEGRLFLLPAAVEKGK